MMACESNIKDIFKLQRFNYKPKSYPPKISCCNLYSLRNIWETKTKTVQKLFFSYVCQSLMRSYIYSIIMPYVSIWWQLTFGIFKGRINWNKLANPWFQWIFRIGEINEAQLWFIPKMLQKSCIHVSQDYFKLQNAINTTLLPGLIFMACDMRPFF